MQQTLTDTIITGIAPGDYLLRTFPSPAPQTLTGLAFHSDETPIHLTRDAPPPPPSPATHAHVHLTVRSAEGQPRPPASTQASSPSTPTPPSTAHR